MAGDPQFEAVYAKVRKVIAEVFKKEEAELTLEMKIIDDLGAESLDIITLLMEFEDAFDRKIPDEDVEKLVTIGDTVQYIMNMLKESPQSQVTSP
jgi:acyl carrier protein